MSTNPFRQIRPQQENLETSLNQSALYDLESRQGASDGSGSKAVTLSVDTKVPPSLDRHVSFASPPVDTTIPAASYPSSPESTRFSPPPQHAQPATPNYRSAFFSDPFGDLGRDGAEDQTIRDALKNAQDNAVLTHVAAAEKSGNAVRDPWSRFGAAPNPPPPQNVEPAEQPAVPRQSLDVEAFKRLLLTGDSGQNTPGAATPPISKPNPRVPSENSSGTDTTSGSQPSVFDQAGRVHEDTPRSSHELDRPEAEGKPKVPPPAPAPRRGKSVKHPAAPESLPKDDPKPAEYQPKPPKKPPTPPLARRRSQRSASWRSEDAIVTPSEASSPTESMQTGQKSPPPPPPPLPPVRRPHSTAQRRLSNDLAPTMEEPGGEPSHPIGNCRSPKDRPMPPPSRNSSTAVKRQSLGLMNPPPLPPPRRGRGSSRSSMDGFRPALSSITGEAEAYDSIAVVDDSRRSSAKDPTRMAPSSAADILAELANLQKEVDAARRDA